MGHRETGPKACELFKLSFITKLRYVRNVFFWSFFLEFFSGVFFWSEAERIKLEASFFLHLNNTVESAVIFFKDNMFIITAAIDNLLNLAFLIMAYLQQQASVSA